MGRDEPPPHADRRTGSGRSKDDPIDRPAARVLLLDAANHVLLLRAIVDPADPQPLWITPGGGLEIGETHLEAAQRELREELNLDAIELSRCVWTRQHLWYWTMHARWYQTRERFYVAHLEGETPRLTLYPDDMLVLDQLRWWTVHEIANAEDEVSPRRLAALLPRILDGDYPDPPIDAGV